MLSNGATPTGTPDYQGPQALLGDLPIWLCADQEPQDRTAEKEKAAAQERERLVLDCLDEVRRIAMNIARRLPSSVAVDDLIQAGTIGLLDAVRLNHRSLDQFPKFARCRITGAILDSLREQDCTSRHARLCQKRLEKATRQLETRLGRTADSEEIAQEISMPMKKFHRFVLAANGIRLSELEASNEQGGEPLIKKLADHSEERPDCLLLRAEEKQRVRAAVQKLPRAEREVLVLYYFDARKMVDIGRSMNCSESRISQIHARALQRMRKLLAPLRSNADAGMASRRYARCRQ
jgi:RNA polymerase sigma factor for flagellar operon FliA